MCFESSLKAVYYCRCLDQLHYLQCNFIYRPEEGDLASVVVLEDLVVVPLVLLVHLVLQVPLLKMKTGLMALMVGSTSSGFFV